MQSKHVINGPSQPALFVVRQTLKSNVSTMGGMKICWHGRSADVRFFRLHAKNVFYFASFSFFDPTRTILLLELSAFVDTNVVPYCSFFVFNTMLIFHGVEQ